MTKTRILGLLAVMVAALLTGTGCGTVEGMGEDLQSLGRSMQGSSERHDGD